MKEDRRDIGVNTISVIPVEDAGELCDEVALNRVALSNFSICDSIEDGISLCIFIMYLECHSPW